MRESNGLIDRNNIRIITISAIALPLLTLVGCGPTPPPRPYYATGPAVVVMAPPAPESTTHYVYGTVNSTNTTHITSESTIHVYSNHPNDQRPPPVITQTTDETQTTEPTPPEEQQPRAEPSVDEPAEPVADTPSAPEPEPAAEPEPPAEPEPAAEPPPETNSSSSDDSNK